eukprot:3637042-Prymnesium_polylepis.2
MAHAILQRSGAQLDRASSSGQSAAIRRVASNVVRVVSAIPRIRIATGRAVSRVCHPERIAASAASADRVCADFRNRI